MDDALASIRVSLLFGRIKVTKIYSFAGNLNLAKAKRGMVEVNSYFVKPIAIILSTLNLGAVKSTQTVARAARLRHSTVNSFV